MDAERIAAALTEAQKRAVLRAVEARSKRGNIIHRRAGDLFPGRGNIEAAGWLRSNPVIGRYFYGGHLAYRLTETGLAVRAIIEKEVK